MKVIDLGLSDYTECHHLQKQLVGDIKNRKTGNHLIITEHRPVITIGRVGSRNNIVVSKEFLKSSNVEVKQVDRGGDITYHGPGQIVIYPIIDLKRHFRDIHKYLRSLEDIAILLLEENSISSFRLRGQTGAWTADGKIASIGIGISGWVTFHGLAINVDCDLLPFKWINPCGFKNIEITSMEKILGSKIDKARIKNRIIDLFYERFENIPAMA